jgi:hypothetical protein
VKRQRWLATGQDSGMVPPKQGVTGRGSRRTTDAGGVPFCEEGKGVVGEPFRVSKVRATTTPQPPPNHPSCHSSRTKGEGNGRRVDWGTHPSWGVTDVTLSEAPKSHHFKGAGKRERLPVYRSRVSWWCPSSPRRSPWQSGER